MRYISEGRYDILFIIGICLYLIFSSYIVPFTHEAGHVLFLKLFHCHYWAHLEYGFFNSFYGVIYEKCDLTQRELALVYIGGVLLTFIIGIFLLILEYILHRKHKTEIAVPILFVSYSYLLDITNYLFFKEGDIVEFMRTVGLEEKIRYLPLLGILIVVLLLTYLYVDLQRELHVIIEEEEHLLKRIIKKIKKHLRSKTSSHK